MSSLFTKEILFRIFLPKLTIPYFMNVGNISSFQIFITLRTIRVLTKRGALQWNEFQR